MLSILDQCSCTVNLMTLKRKNTVGPLCGCHDGAEIGMQRNGEAAHKASSYYMYTQWVIGSCAAYGGSNYY
jgi:hypothetical protein